MRISGLFLIPILISSITLVVGTTSGGEEGIPRGNIVVDVNGSGDYTSIREAVNNSHPGDVIRIKKGTYREHLLIDRPLTIRSFDAERPVIENDEDSSNTIDIMNNEFTYLLDLEITHPYGNGSVVVCRSSETYLTNCIIRDGGDGVAAEGFLFRMENCTLSDLRRAVHVKGFDIGIDNCSFADVREGISVHPDFYQDQKIDVRKCIFNGVKSDSISVEGESGDFFQSARIRDVNVTGCGGWGLTVNNSAKNLVVENVTVVNDGAGGKGIHVHSMPDSKGIRIIDCRLIGNLVGMNVSGGEENNMAFAEENKIVNNRVGLQICGSLYSIRNNEIRENDLGVIFLYGSSLNLFYNNKVVENSVQIIPGGSLNELSFTYIYGGNYWSDYEGIDCRKGDGQDIPGSDGYGDVPYRVNTTFCDLYPIIIDKVRPVADAGGNATIDEGEMFRFSIENSTDDNMVTRGVWDFRYDGKEWRVHGTEFYFRFDYPGIFPVNMTVYDFAGNNDTDVMVITAVDVRSPLVSPAEDMIAEENTWVNLSCGDYSDTGEIERVEWLFDYEGSAHVLEGENVSYFFDTPGILNITFRVWDTAGNFGETSFDLTVLDLTDPLADAGADIFLENGGTAVFDGSGSTDNGEIVACNWTFTYGGEKVSLYGPAPAFAFEIPGTYTVNLTVVDFFGNIGTDRTVVTVRDTIPPTARIAGKLTSVSGREVSLSGNGSSDNFGIRRYEWSWRDPDPRTTDGVDFSCVFSEPGDHIIGLTVWDWQGNSDSDNVTVHITDTRSPRAEAGENMTVPVGSGITLDGSGSWDDDLIVRWEWKISAVGFSKEIEGEIVQCFFDEPGVYEVLLMVYDPSNNFDDDTIIIEVLGTGTLSGIVTDNDGNPIPYADITVTDTSGVANTTISGADGSFEIEVPAGKVSWRISADGYRILSGEARINATETTVIAPVMDKAKGSNILYLATGIVAVILLLSLIAVLYFISRRTRGKEVDDSPAREAGITKHLSEKAPTDIYDLVE